MRKDGLLIMTDIAQIKKNIVPVAQKYGLKKLYLFGSYAKGTANDRSDVDLLIEKGLPLSLLKLSGLRQDASDALGMEVDVVSMSGIDKEFWEEIRGTEVLLYES